METQIIPLTYPFFQKPRTRQFDNANLKIEKTGSTRETSNAFSPNLARPVINELVQVPRISQERNWFQWAAPHLTQIRHPKYFQAWFLVCPHAIELHTAPPLLVVIVSFKPSLYHSVDALPGVDKCSHHPKCTIPASSCALLRNGLRVIFFGAWKHGQTYLQ